MVNELEGKVAIVTGGAAGLGRAMVERFVEEGARVAIADIDDDKGTALAEKLGPAAVFIRTDVSEADQIEALVDATVEQLGGLHILVNNAGIPGRLIPRFLDDDLSDFHRIIDVDLLGVMLCTRIAGGHMAAHGGGSIVNIASIAGTRPGRSEWPYRAAKAGVVHFSRCVAMDLAEEGIRVNCITPGGVLSDMLLSSTKDGGDHALVEKVRGMMRQIRPLDTDGLPSDVAEAALYLASDRARYVTGTVLPVDGGMTLGKSNSLKPSAPDQVAEKP